MAAKRIIVNPVSRFAQYVRWRYRTEWSQFEFTYNGATKLFVGERTGDDEYSGMSDGECRRVIGELNLELIGL